MVQVIVYISTLWVIHKACRGIPFNPMNHWLDKSCAYIVGWIEINCICINMWLACACWELCKIKGYHIDLYLDTLHTDPFFPLNYKYSIQSGSIARTSGILATLRPSQCNWYIHCGYSRNPYISTLNHTRRVIILPLKQGNQHI